jgi:hypothetical protein
MAEGLQGWIKYSYPVGSRGETLSPAFYLTETGYIRYFFKEISLLIPVHSSLLALYMRHASLLPLLFIKQGVQFLISTVMYHQ